jgi:hypothetical protein
MPNDIAMKNAVHLFFQVLVFAGVLLIAGCKEENEKPYILIEDEAGIVIELTWSTGGTDEQSINEADLDIYVYDNTPVEVYYANGDSSFETLLLENSIVDGKYVVSAYTSINTAAVNYTMEISGVTVEKSFIVTGSFTSGADGAEHDRFQIIKTGTKFKIVKL